MADPPDLNTRDIKFYYGPPVDACAVLATSYLLDPSDSPADTLEVRKLYVAEVVVTLLQVETMAEYRLKNFNGITAFIQQTGSVAGLESLFLILLFANRSHRPDAETAIRTWNAARKTPTEGAGSIMFYDVEAKKLSFVSHDTIASLRNGLHIEQIDGMAALIQSTAKRVLNNPFVTNPLPHIVNGWPPPWVRQGGHWEIPGWPPHFEPGHPPHLTTGGPPIWVPDPGFQLHAAPAPPAPPGPPPANDADIIDAEIKIVEQVSQAYAIAAGVFGGAAAAAAALGLAAVGAGPLIIVVVTGTAAAGLDLWAKHMATQRAIEKLTEKPAPAVALPGGVPTIPQTGPVGPGGGPLPGPVGPDPGPDDGPTPHPHGGGGGGGPSPSPGGGGPAPLGPGPSPPDPEPGDGPQGPPPRPDPPGPDPDPDPEPGPQPCPTPVGPTPGPPPPDPDPEPSPGPPPNPDPTPGPPPDPEPEPTPGPPPDPSPEPTPAPPPPQPAPTPTPAPPPPEPDPEPNPGPPDPPDPPGPVAHPGDGVIIPVGHPGDGVIIPVGHPGDGVVIPVGASFHPGGPLLNPGSGTGRTSPTAALTCCKDLVLV